jgi:hypothetical protein
VTATCPSCGASSATDDYCDQCGTPIAAAPAASAAPAAAAPPVSGTCPSCGAERTGDDAFCEVCGLDFATGKLPAAPARPKPAASSAPAAASGWVAVVEADEAFFRSNQADSPTPIAFPKDLAAREVDLSGDEVEIGRRRDDRGHFPGIDLGGAVEDPAVSHRHAVLRRAADGWVVVDVGSTNGTWLNDGPEPVKQGTPVPLRDGDRIHLGAFTTITVKRRAQA